MRFEEQVWACERHGVAAAGRLDAAFVPKEQRARAHKPKPRAAAVLVAPRREPTRPVVRTEPQKARTAPRRVTTQTTRLLAMQSEIVARNEAGESLAKIADDLWEELGYASHHVCASKISRFLKVNGVPAAAVRSGPSPGSRPAARFTEERYTEVRAALESGENTWGFAGRRWQEWGFSSRSSCDSLIRKWIRTRAEERATLPT